MRNAMFLFAMTVLVLTAPARSQLAPNNPKDLSDAMKAIKSADPIERTAGLTFIALLGNDAKVASRDVVNLLYDSNKDVRDWANRALPKINPTIAGPVMTLMNSNNEDAKLQAMADLAKLKGAGAPAIPALMRLLESSKGADKAAVINALGSVGTKDPTLSTTMINLAMRDPDPAVRAAAYKALPTLDDKAGATEVIASMLKNTDPAQRSAALVSIGHFAKGHPPAIQLIRNSLGDPSPTVRETAKQVLAKVEAMK